jgi:hypothetical protein
MLRAYPESRPKFTLPTREVPSAEGESDAHPTYKPRRLPGR